MRRKKKAKEDEMGFCYCFVCGLNPCTVGQMLCYFRFQPVCLCALAILLGLTGSGNEEESAGRGSMEPINIQMPQMESFSAGHLETSKASLWYANCNLSSKLPLEIRHLFLKVSLTLTSAASGPHSSQLQPHPGLDSIFIFCIYFC